MSPPPDEFPLDGHPDVPTVLIYAAEDEFFNPDWERFMAREVLGLEPIEIPGGHFPMAEDPAALADLLAVRSRSGANTVSARRPRRSRRRASPR